MDSLAGGEWLLRRLRQSLARLWQSAMENGADLGQAYQNNPSIDRAKRRIEGLKRSFHRDLRRLYTRAEAQSTASFMQKYGAPTVKELDEAMDAECVQEKEYEAGKQAKKNSAAMPARSGRAGPATSSQAGPRTSRNWVRFVPVNNIR